MTAVENLCKCGNTKSASLKICRLCQVEDKLKPIIEHKHKLENVIVDMRMSLGQMSNFSSKRICNWIRQLEEIL